MYLYIYVNMLTYVNGATSKKVNRKVQGVPRLQTAANPRHQEEEKKKDKTNTYKTNKQMNEKHIDQLPLPRAR